MVAASNLDEIVQSLETNEFRTRIKKLLFCACYKRWETDLDKLESMSFYELIEELYRLAPTLDRLISIFIRIVDRINKKYIYFLIATQVLRILKDLYPLSELNVIHNKVKVSDDKLKYIPALFDWKFLVDLKFKVSRYTSLSRSKILIFSALNYEFQYSTKDWSLLNHQEFDDLVRNFFYDCGTIEELRFRLYGAANYLEDREKNLEVANIILESMNHFYIYLQQRHDRETESTARGKSTTQFASEPTSFYPEVSDQSHPIYPDHSPSQKSPRSYPSLLITNLLNVTSSERFQEIVNSEKLTKDPEADRRLKESIQTRVDRILIDIEAQVKELEVEIKLSLISSKSDEYLETRNKGINIFLHRLKISYLKYLKTLNKS